jgi:MFS family permease
MKQSELSARQRLSILAGASVMLSLAMGMRQSLGLFQPYMVHDIGITPAQFALALAVQNIFWGITQPFVGMFSDRVGSRWVAVAGVALYCLGLYVSMIADSAGMVIFGCGLCIGLALSCTTSNMAMTATSLAVAPARRSAAMSSGARACRQSRPTISAAPAGLISRTVKPITNLIAGERNRFSYLRERLLCPTA